MDVGFAIFDKVMDRSSVWSPVDKAWPASSWPWRSWSSLALVGVNMLLLLASGWVLAYGGVFFLGFGGSRWTSDMAINYYKVVLGVPRSSSSMVLLVGIGKTFLDDYYSRMSAGISLKEMGVMLIVVIILLALVNKDSAAHRRDHHRREAWAVPASASSVQALRWVPQAWRQQRPPPAAPLWPPAASAAGGASAVMAAFSKANENNVGRHGRYRPSPGGGGSGGGAGGGSDASTGSTRQLRSGCGL